jgi:hypothetical protein
MIKLAWDEFFTLEPNINRKAYPLDLSKTDILKTLTVIIVEVDNNNNNNNNKYLS